jgi:hypothetical protein
MTIGSVIAVPDLGAPERMPPQTGRMYACNRPVHLMKRNFAPHRRGEFRGIFGESNLQLVIGQGGLITTDQCATGLPGLWTIGAARSGYGGMLVDAEKDA